MTKKVFVLGGNDYRSMFVEAGYDTDCTPDNADLICFTGGTDINPAIYDQSRHHTTDIPDIQRDNHEVGIFKFAVLNNIPMVGICRGAQLLCVMSGGSLIQHIEGHGMSHEMTTYDGRKMLVSSSHHQMMDIRNPADAVLLGYAESRSKSYLTDTRELSPSQMGDKDIEVVYFALTNALCHQPHPEWMDNRSAYVDFFFETINVLLFKEVNDNANRTISL